MDFLQLNGDVVFICLVAVALLFTIACAIYVMVKASRGHGRHPKLFVTIIVNFLLLALIIYVLLPLFPSWGRTQALQAANSFLGYLHTGDYRSAQDLIINGMSADDYEKIRPSLEDPANWPTSWELKITGGKAPGYIATGVVVLPNDRKIPVTIGADWEWQTATWKVVIVLYNPYSERNDTDIHLLLSATNTSYSVVRLLPIFLSVVSVFISIRYLQGLISRPER